MRPYFPMSVSQPRFDNSPRVRELIRAGNLYLTLADALRLAIENNLDVELERFSLPVADMELTRAKGGGFLRGVPFLLAETPSGVGGPNSPLVTAAASAGTTPGTTVASNALELGVLSAPQTNLSLLGTIPDSSGPAVPQFDPALVGELNWTHQTSPQASSFATGTNALVTNTGLANVGYQQGFSTGTLVNIGFANSHESLNSLRSSLSPFTLSSFGVTVTQPLLRGFGPSLNRRFIRIARNEQRMTNLLFQQQLIATVYGVVRLYTDLVALYEDQKVKEETLALARKLYDDTKAQVEEGTLAPVELTRANAQVSSSLQDLANARGLLEEQEAILKNVLTRTGLEDAEVRASRIIPTDTLSVPEKEVVAPIEDLMKDAVARRPDLAQGVLQVENSQITIEGSRNALLPEVDLVGVAQNSGLAGQVNPLATPNSNDPRFLGGYGSVLDQVATRKFPTYGVGVQLTLPFRNRIAQSDLARDEIQLRQTQIRLRQLQNQARLEIEDALIAMRRSRAAYEAAVETRKLQEESLAAEQEKFAVGASTAFFVIQYESYLAQARSAEVVAKSAYVKARAALQRATGSILDDNHISMDTAYKGRP
ncbi:MAG TPA: TolC family protein [Bryobacteraceae bacterium]|nr:TolC family protein [Bryobacteraceae bacterium]